MIIPKTDEETAVVIAIAAPPTITALGSTPWIIKSQL